MRKKNTQTLGEAIKDYISAMHFDDKMQEINLIREWKKLVGEYINKSTRNVYIKNNKLFVYLSSSIIRAELHMIKNSLLKKLNDKTGKKIIEEIILR